MKDMLSEALDGSRVSSCLVNTLRSVAQIRTAMVSPNNKSSVVDIFVYTQ